MADKEASLLLRIKTAGAEAVDSLSDKFDSIKEIGVAAFAAVSAVVIKSIAEYREAEESSNRLTQAMVNQGLYSKDLKESYEAQAAALQKLTTFGDDEIISAQASLQSYLGQTQVSKELTQATLDLAAAKKIDLASAAEMVGKSIGTTTNALGRHGIEVDATASKTEKLSQVINGINKNWEGQAAAAAQGLGGMEQLKHIIGDLFETIGGRLAPVITLFVNGIKSIATNAAIVNPIIDAFVGSLHILTNIGVMIGGVFEAAGKMIGNVFGTAIQTVTQVLEGDFKGALKTQLNQISIQGDAIAEAYKNTTDRMKAVDEAFLASKQDNAAKEEQLIKDSNERKRIIAQENAVIAQEEEMARKVAAQEQEMAMIGQTEEQKSRIKIDAQLKEQQEILKNATTAQGKLAAQNEIYRLNEQKRELLYDEARKAARSDTLSKIASLQNSSNSTLAAAGKGAAITQIAIETPVAISKALSAFPPPFNFVAAGLVGAAMATQAANIAGVQLAEGGIVQARPGGIQATIGEGGQDEAVIPLDRAGEFGLGGGGTTVIINAYGGVLGNESEARQFAIAVDEQLLKLRQNNESQAFDSGVV